MCTLTTSQCTCLSLNLPDDAESLNKGVLNTIKDQVRDSSLVGALA